MKSVFGLCTRLFAVGSIIAVAGCASTPQQAKTHRFTPLPTPQVKTANLEPAKPRSTTELLRAADRAFQEGNKAQESGDTEAALRNYKQMLELLIEADPDPVIFYNLRNEFGRILDNTTQQAYILEKGRPREYSDVAMSDTGVVGDLPIPFPLNERIIAEIEEIQEVYRNGYQSGLDRSFKYAPMVRHKLAEAGLPQDLVWLAMVESQFKNQAKSTAGAVGMWQFMPATGRRYGLRVDNYVDERRNWEKATDAAVTYLKDLYQMFGEWPLAISAYNCGEYGMERTVAMAGGEKDLWKILEGPAADRMQRETQKFFPKLVASVVVASSPERYGFEVNPQPPDQYLRVPVKGMYSLAKLEKACGLPDDTLKSLNPDLVRGVTPPSGEFALAVPGEANARLITALSEIPEERGGVALASIDDESSVTTSRSTQSTMKYKVRRGDTLAGIASRFRVPLKDLMKTNQLRSSKNLAAGKTLTIPGKDGDAPEEVELASAKGVDIHQVRKGDTLSKIADKYDISTGDLKQWNGLDDHNIQVNQELRVAPPSDTQEKKSASAGQEKRLHVVKAGEFPGTIAAKYGVSVDELLKWNNMTNKSVIRANDKLVVYAAPAAAPETPKPDEIQTASVEKSTPASSSSTQMHKVASGETPGCIAQKYNIKTSDFLAWNGLARSSNIQAGKEYYVSDPKSAASPAAQEPEKKEKAEPVSKKEGAFQVASGESAWTIAKKHGVSVEDLCKWNGWDAKKVLKVGDAYALQGGASETAPAAEPSKAEPSKAEPSKAEPSKAEPSKAEPSKAEPSKAEPSKAEASPASAVHIVAAGDTPSGIAKQYGVKVADLTQWNAWDKKHVIKVGEKVTIKK